MSDREFLFEYGFRGVTYGITIHAANPTEARDKLSAAAFAPIYKGEVAAKVPVSPRSIWRWLTQQR